MASAAPSSVSSSLVEEVKRTQPLVGSDDKSSLPSSSPKDVATGGVGTTSTGRLASSRRIRYHVTGFGEFAGVAVNPTTALMETLPTCDALTQAKSPDWQLMSATVLETSGEGSKQQYNELRRKANQRVAPEEKAGDWQIYEYNDRDIIDIWIHFGVYDGSEEYRIEHMAYNEATFGVPDQRGWQPEELPVVWAAPAGLTTRLPIDHLVSRLSARADDSKSIPVVRSEDPGRFVCNWLYYQSLWSCYNSSTEALFIHVPNHKVANLEAQQKFAVSVFSELTNLLLHPQPVVRYHLTGFGEFNGVKTNPTAELMECLQSMCGHPHIISSQWGVDSYTVLEVSGQGSKAELESLRSLAGQPIKAAPSSSLPSLPPSTTSTSTAVVAPTPASTASAATDEKAVSPNVLQLTPDGALIIDVWVHFGVDSKATEFRVESRAANDASFRVADQRGWQPSKQEIVSGGPSFITTTLPVDALVAHLRGIPPIPVAPILNEVRRSDDAGRFVCNWIYYQSLWQSSHSKTQSLFVHVPPESVADIELQGVFTCRLLSELADLLIFPPSTPTTATTATPPAAVTTAVPTL